MPAFAGMTNCNPFSLQGKARVRGKKALCVILIFLTLNLFWPKITFSNDSRLVVKAEVTKHPPEFASTPEVDAPTEKETKMSNWTWAILGLVVVGGLAAAGGGGGGGGGGSTTGGSGSVTVGW